jgi:hypothetical protein
MRDAVAEKLHSVDDARKAIRDSESRRMKLTATLEGAQGELSRAEELRRRYTLRRVLAEESRSRGEILFSSLRERCELLKQGKHQRQRHRTHQSSLEQRKMVDEIEEAERTLMKQLATNAECSRSLDELRVTLDRTLAGQSDALEAMNVKCSIVVERIEKLRAQRRIKIAAQEDELKANRRAFFTLFQDFLYQVDEEIKRAVEKYAPKPFSSRESPPPRNPDASDDALATCLRLVHMYNEWGDSHRAMQQYDSQRGRAALAYQEAETSVAVVAETLARERARLGAVEEELALQERLDDESSDALLKFAEASCVEKRRLEELIASAHEEAAAEQQAMASEAAGRKARIAAARQAVHTLSQKANEVAAEIADLHEMGASWNIGELAKQLRRGEQVHQELRALGDHSSYVARMGGADAKLVVNPPTG